MADNKINKLLNPSSKLTTTNSLLSSINTINTKLTSNLLVSTNLNSSILGKSLLDDRKKKAEETIGLLESKKPKLSLSNSNIVSSPKFDNLLLTSSLSNTLLKSQGLHDNLLSSHSSTVSKPLLSTTSKTLISKKENLQNYSIKEQSTIKSGLNIVIRQEKITIDANEADSNSSNIRQVFADLTNSFAYLDLIKTINEKNEKFDEETKHFEVENSQFLGYPSARLAFKGDQEIVNLKNTLINLVSSSLLKAPNFKDTKDQTRMNILDVSNRIIPFDGEFILKLALYTRKELNIRVTSNFLLSIASLQDNCRKFIQRYYSASVVLPSDWIDVAEQYQSFGDTRIKFGAIPSALRKAMVEKFSDFDEYQLAKYNKDKSKSKKSSKMNNIKHIKAHLKLDQKGNKMEESQANEDSACEEKYMMTLNNGIKINDFIKADILVKENCKTLKIDLVAKSGSDQQNDRSKRLVSRRGKPIPGANKGEKPEESVPLRFTIDYAYERVTKKTFLNKTWSKPDVKMNSSQPFLKVSNQNTVVNIRINVTASEFQIFVNDETRLLVKQEHRNHNIELSKINCIRVSGADIKLNELIIESGDKIDNDENDDEEEIKQKTFTLKQLIRQLHISKPIQHVFGLLGKKYPESYDDYVKSGLPGLYESEKAGKRMRLAIPETWETQISMKGNKASVWEQLIDNKKLPYMAMLRNLRNMIKAGIDEKHHQWVIKKLQDEGAVINSKQFPISFFSAYDVIDELQKDFQEYLTWNDAGENELSNRRNKKNKEKEKKYKDMAYDEDILKRYKKAVDNALKVATTYNISPIKGRTIILLDTNESTGLECKTARIGKSKRTVTEIASLLGLMFKYSCEDSRLLIYTHQASSKCIEIQLQPGTILDNMVTIKQLQNHQGSSKYETTMETVLRDLISQQVLVDNLIILSQGLTDNTDLVLSLNQFLSKYRVCVNRKLLFVNVDLGAQDTKLMLNNKSFGHENDVTINGYSDSILRFVAERGNQGQLLHIENIDKSFDLPPLKLHKKSDEKMDIDISNTIERPFEITNTIPNWTTAKVFISSTFRDMHSERDILSRVVFPLLKSKLNARFINVQEVDLRWGITETEASDNRTLDICLKQILECEFFIGILGERYGHVPDSYQVKRVPQFNWVCDYPKGASITELEIQCAAFEKNKNNKQTRLEKLFFYFRDNSFMNHVPESLNFHFASEDQNTARKLDNLKQKIISNGFEVFDGYKCDWFGIDQQGRALITNLDEFAQRVFDNLLNAITIAYPYENRSQLDEFSHITGLHESFIKTCSEKFVGRRKLVVNCEKLLKDQMQQFSFKPNNPHVLLVEGDFGVGKTSFLCYLINVLRDFTSHVYAHVIGACSGSEYIIPFLKRFAIEVIRNYNLKISENIAKDSNDLKVLKKLFVEILNELNSIVSDKFIIVIDGVDLMLDQNGNLDESLSWLPEKIPANITIVLSARKTSRIQEVLNKRVMSFSKKDNVEHKFHYDKFLIAELEILEKGEIIRQNLNAYDKRLNESGFNNQMKFLTGKKDASVPLYLAIACEELRFHNNFDTLTDKLKEIPQKLTALIPYTLSRLETDYGASYITSAFSFLLCSKDGLKDYELKEMINLYHYLEEEMLIGNLEKTESILEIKKYTNLSKLDMAILKSNSDAKFLSFIESISETFLKPFANDNTGSLNIRLHPVILNCLRIKFTKSNLIIENINKIMALYFWVKLDKQLEFNWSTSNVRGYTYLPYHLSAGSCPLDVVQILCDLKFLAGKSMLGLSSQLLQDFEFHNATKAINIIAKGSTNKNGNQTKFNEFKKFFTENYHIISRSPPLLFQQAMNQPANSAPTENLKLILRDKSISFMFEETNKEIEAPEIGKVLPLTIKDFNASISSVAMSANGQYLACGTEDCEIKLFLLSTATLVRKFQGHSGKINDLCFVGTDTLCSSSSDGLASLWNVSGGYRIKILNKHNGHCVSACSAEPKGKFLVTVGWDCSVKIWNSIDGSLSGEMRGHGRPINCVAYHPEGEIIATGCWDGCIRIFNVFKRERKAVFRGQNGSIRSISFSRNGVYVSSASISGDVILWSVLTGAQVGVYRGHSLPVNCLRYSPTSEILVTGSSDRKVKLWPATPGKCIKVIQDKIAATCVCFDQKMGKFIAVGYHTGELKIYDLNTFKQVPCKPHKAHVKRVKFNSNSKFVISGAEDGTVKITSFTSKSATVIADLIGSTSSINAISVNSLDTIITGSEDSLIRIYAPYFEDLANEDKVDPVKILNQHTSAVTACSFNSDGTKFVSASKDATLIIWKLVGFSREATELFRISSAHPDWITDCHWSSSSDFILTSSIDFTMKIFSADTGVHKTTMTGHGAGINTCAFKYGCAISTCADGSTKVWSHKGHEITTLLGHQSRVNGCDLFVKVISPSDDAKQNSEEPTEDEPMQDWAEAVNEDDRRQIVEAAKINKTLHKVDQVVVATVSDDCSIRIWRPLESDDILCLQGHNERVESLILGSNNFMATTSSDKSIKIWNLSNFMTNFNQGKIIHSEKQPRGHNRNITNINFSSKHSLIFTTSKDGILIIWSCNYENDKLNSLNYLRKFDIHSAACTTLCIVNETENLIELATGSDDKTIKIWNLNTTDLSIDLKNTLYETRPVIFLNTIKTTDKNKTKHSLIALECLSTKLFVTVFDISNNYSKSKTGCIIHGYTSFIYETKIINSNLYITLINDGILKVNIDEITSSFKNYFSYDNKLKKIVSREVLFEKDEKWFTCIADTEDENSFIAGDCKGNLHKVMKDASDIKLIKKIHESHITDMFNLKFGNNSRLITASQDGSVKIWNSDAEKQLGQYNFNCGITCIKNVSMKNNKITIICADESCDIHILIWHDKSF